MAVVHLQLSLLIFSAQSLFLIATHGLTSALSAEGSFKERVPPKCLAVTHKWPAHLTIHSVEIMREAKPCSLVTLSTQSSTMLTTSPFFIFSCNLRSSHGSGERDTWTCSIFETRISSYKPLPKILTYAPCKLEHWSWQQNPNVEKTEKEGFWTNPNFHGPCCILSNSRSY